MSNMVLPERANKPPSSTVENGALPQRVAALEMISISVVGPVIKVTSLVINEGAWGFKHDDLADRFDSLDYSYHVVEFFENFEMHQGFTLIIFFEKQTSVHSFILE